MKILVTGATGFLGKQVVAAACERGHAVRAVIRPATITTPDSWSDNPLIETAIADLRNAKTIAGLLTDIDVVVHLAAAKAGSLYEQFAATVIGTENLLKEMSEQNVGRIVLCSSFSVYEYLDRWSWGELNEDSPLVREPRLRDEYSQTKLVQEQLVRDTAEKLDWQCVILRPGVIYGPDNLWTARLGQQVSDRWWVRTGAFAPLPLTYVENCAEAFVDAAEYSGPDRELTLNVVDDETPSQRTYLKSMRKATNSRAKIFPIPWFLLRSLARTAWLTNAVCFRGTAKLPGLLRPAALHARCKPLRYTNQKLRTALGWSPRFSLQEGLQRSVGSAK